MTNVAKMIRKNPKRIARKEVFRFYIVERDPNPQFRVFPCEFIKEDEKDGWH
jgi:hypothetical protein